MNKTFIAFVNVFNIIGCFLWLYNYYHVRKDRKELARTKELYEEARKSFLESAQAKREPTRAEVKRMKHQEERQIPIKRIRSTDRELSDFLEEQERSRNKDKKNH
jgi:hemolysin activation/secretion protein